MAFPSHGMVPPCAPAGWMYSSKPSLRMHAVDSHARGGTTNMAKAWRFFNFYDERLVGRSPTGASQSDLFRLSAVRVRARSPEPKSLKPSAAVTILMLEILVIVIVMLVSMARHGKGRRRNFSNYLRGSIDHVLTMATLNTNTLVGSVLSQSVIDKTRISSVVLNWALSNFTPAQNDGPILVGVAHSDYTDAEVESVIENSGSWDPGNLANQEIAQRLVRSVGVFDIPEAATQSVALNDGKPIKTKLNWQLNEGDTLRVWAYNTGSTALATTVPNLHVNGHANLWQV